MTNLLQHDLESHVEGDVRFDALTRRLYAVDASIYEIEPIGVILPKRRQDVINTILVAKKHGVPIIARGAATGIAGGCIGRGLVIDCSKHLTRIIEIDYEKEEALCEPGVVQDQLNAALAARGYRLGPDTSTGNRATLGGMIGNNAAGARSLKYGKTVDAVQSLELVLSDGEVLTFAEIEESEARVRAKQEDREGAIYRAVLKIRDEHGPAIQKAFPNIPRRASGYNLDELIKPGPLNLAKVIVGSEGSLGIATRIRVKIAKRPKETGLVVVHCMDLLEGMEALTKMLAFNPIAVELIDEEIIKMGRVSPSMRGRLGWMENEPAALFVVELESETEGELREKMALFIAAMQEAKVGYAWKELTVSREMDHVWALRKAGLGLLLSRRSYSKAIAFIEDLTVPPERLAAFMKEFQEYLHSIDKRAGIYGHAGSGCLHIRPYMNLSKQEDLDLMKRVMVEITDLVMRHGGSLSGEHGDGLIRSWLNKKLFGEEVYQAFEDLKAAFDEDGRMNPGKVVATQGLTENLRIDPSVKPVEVKTALSFKHEGGLAFAAEMCNGNAQCRKKKKTMCPSFQVTGDEKDTTRARAQALRAVLNGHWPLEELTGDALHDVLDLCLECKGCKKECPSQVDMAKMKAEVLYQRQEKLGYSLRTKIFGHVGRLSQYGCMAPRLANWAADTQLSKYLMEKVGITPERSLPPFTRERFSQWMKKKYVATGQSKRVVLFNDTFMEFNYPELGQSAVQVLNGLGYEVIVPNWTCCGRTYIGKGMLRQAKKLAERLVDQFYPLAREGLPIVGIEPSCLLTIKDELRDLVGGPKARQVVDAAMTIDEFLAQHIEGGQWPLSMVEKPMSMKVHGHCHQKAIVGMAPTMKVLKQLPGCDVSLISSGCCGMAGSFGYESEHYDFSLKVGETQLLPAVRATPSSTVLVANGVSCRSQVAHMAERQAKHLVEVVADAMTEESNLPL